MIMQERIEDAKARALAILSGDHNLKGGGWAVLKASSRLWSQAGLDFDSFLVAAIRVGNDLCIADRVPLAEASSKIGRAWDEVQREIANGGSERELDFLDRLGMAHTYAQTVLTGRTGTTDLAVYRGILLIAASAHRVTGLGLGRYRLSEIANVSDATVKASLKRLTGHGLIEQTGTGLTTQWKLHIPVDGSPFGDLDFGVGFAADLFTTGHGIDNEPRKRDEDGRLIKREGRGLGIGPLAQRVFNILDPKEKQSAADIAAALGVSLNTAKKALDSLEGLNLAINAGKNGRAVQWLLYPDALTERAIEDAGFEVNIAGNREARKEQHDNLRAFWQQWRPRAA